jgi:hypothetical protein
MVKLSQIVMRDESGYLVHLCGGVLVLLCCGVIWCMNCNMHLDLADVDLEGRKNELHS